MRKAIEFVELNGNEVERARQRFLLTGKRPRQEIVAELFAGQRPDGGLDPVLGKRLLFPGRYLLLAGPG
jgi:hypothetical protein